jgi:acylphosphatase
MAGTKTLRDSLRLWLDPSRLHAGSGLVARDTGACFASMSRQRLQVCYSGRVQGVGFRYTTKHLALGFEVTGSVRNLPDGRVELTLEGERSELEAFREAVRESELGHFIRTEDVRWGDARNEFRGFDIVA